MRTPGDLTEVLLRKPSDPCIHERLEVRRARIAVANILPATIESLHDERTLITELTYIRVGYRQSQLFQPRRAQRFVVDRMGEIKSAVANQPKWEFQNVGCRGRAKRLIPMSTDLGQRGFLLRTCE
jgi:hypothetical protein